MASQETLIERLGAIERLLSQPVAITRAPTEIEHNESARILRNGLVVTLFAALEDFARSRSEELLKQIALVVAFVSLPVKLQEAATVGAAEAISFRLKFEEKGSVRRQFVQAHSQSIASTLGTPYTVSTLAFLHGAPNVSEDALSSFMKCFGIESPWEQIDAISARLGITLLSAKEAFANLLERRNAAAHQADSAIEHGDILAGIDAVYAIAVSADLLLSSATSDICRGNAPGEKGRPKRRAGDFQLRFIEQQDKPPRKWREIREGATRASHVYSDLAIGIAEAKARCVKEKSHLVVFRNRKRVGKWVSP